MRVESLNPFPSDEEIRAFLSLLSDQMAPFREMLQEAEVDMETTFRFMPLAQTLTRAREHNSWKIPFVAKALQVSQRTLKTLEEGTVGKDEPAALGAYIRFLALEDIYRWWAQSNPELAQSWQLPLDSETPTNPEASPPPGNVVPLFTGPASASTSGRPAHWPPAKPFDLPPNSFELSKNVDVNHILDGLLPPEFGVPVLPDEPPEMPFKPAGPARPPAIYQFKLTLEDVRPQVWRRFLVPNQFTLAKLHEAIQIIMGWTNSHLHQFAIEDRQFGTPDQDWDGVSDERRARLRDFLLEEGDEFLYTYDFGDDWRHRLRLEKVQPAEKDFVPVCLKAVGACPPEDCGGPWGYDGLLEAIRNPKHPDHRTMKEWLGDDFDPKTVDLEETNAILAEVFKRRTRGRRK